VNGLGDQPSGGTLGGPESDQSILRGLVDQALLLSRSPGALESTPGGIAPSRMLGDFMVTGLQALWDATGPETPLEKWLSDALDVDAQQLAQDGSAALARLLDATALDPRIQFRIPAMTVEEDREDVRDALLASEEFGQISDDLPNETDTMNPL
jgi:hypothetical protein